MNTKNSIVELKDPFLSHTLTFINFLLAFFLSDNLLWLISLIIPKLLTVISIVFKELTFTLIFAFFYLGITRALTTYLPFLVTSIKVNYYIPIFSLLILYHPLIIFINGPKIVVNWFLVDIIRFGTIFSWLLETSFLVFTGYTSSLIIDRSEFNREGKSFKYIKYLGGEIANGLMILYVVYFILRSFILEGFESVILTLPIKLILVYLFYVSLSPSEDPINEDQ